MAGDADGGGKIRVVGRVRPLGDHEIKKNAKEVIVAVNDDPTKAGSALLQVTEANDKIRWFELDAVFDKNSTQQEVYDRCGAKDAVTEDIFNGFNCTILAYGQTGAGKTFSMGTASHSKEIGENDGIIPRCCHDLFKTIDEKCDGNAKVELSYLEIYNEELRDLLVDDKNMKKLLIREDLKGEVYVQGLEKRVVCSPGDIGDIMEEASGRRVVAATAMNAVSSRSHAMCILKIEGVVEGPNGSDKFTAKLTLVDLAGSERAKKTGATGSRLKEGVNINKSLLVLGQVVAALAEKSKKHARRPPYRDSKLTRLLQDSLGGNSRTIMVACCSPADFNIEESINSLRYATSARNIKQAATRNVIQNISQEEAMKLKRENELLKIQVKDLTEQLRLMALSSEEEYEYEYYDEYESGEEGEEAEGEEEGEEEEAEPEEEEEEPEPEPEPEPEAKEPEVEKEKEPEKSKKITFANPGLPPLSEQMSENNLGVPENLARSGATDEYVKDLEKQLEALREECNKLKRGLRRSSATTVMMPAMKVELAMLREEMNIKEELEMENERLREQLAEAEADAESARIAATKLAICNAQLQASM